MGHTSMETCHSTRETCRSIARKSPLPPSSPDPFHSVVDFKLLIFAKEKKRKDFFQLTTSTMELIVNFMEMSTDFDGYCTGLE